MRKLFISADMEGCAAVSAPQALMHDRWAWEWTSARRWMTQEVAAASEAALEAGFSEVIVADGHGSAHSIEPEGLPDNVRLVRSWPRPLLQMQGVEVAGVEACAFVGYHAPAGTADSVLAHSYSGASYRSIRVNGEMCSEGYLNAALAGERGLSIVFVSGDTQTIDDAARYAPEAVRFISKQSLGWRSQMSLPPAQVCRMLKASFADALRKPVPKPFVLSGPYRLEAEMTSYVAAETLSYLPCVSRVGAFGVEATFLSVEATIRFISFAMLYSPTGVPPI